MSNPSLSDDIAVIGLSCRMPGAENVAEFWQNLIDGKDTIHRFTKEELQKTSLASDLKLNNPNFVGAKGILKNVEWFDAEFFGFNPFDAKMMDPQQRLLLECVWEALES